MITVNKWKQRFIWKVHYNTLWHSQTQIDDTLTKKTVKKDGKMSMGQRPKPNLKWESRLNQQKHVKTTQTLTHTHHRNVSEWSSNVYLFDFDVLEIDQIGIACLFLLSQTLFTNEQKKNSNSISNWLNSHRHKHTRAQDFLQNSTATNKLFRQL